MKSLIIFFVLLSNYCYCQELLGGWRETDDESLKKTCLNLALTQITGAQGNNDDLQSQIVDLTCVTQIVNGRNIKCNFDFRGQKHQCSYYQSFTDPDNTEPTLLKCKDPNSESIQEEKDDKDLVEEQTIIDEDEQVGEEQQPVLRENEIDDEDEIDAANKQIQQENEQ